jgi:hypothetical protein
MAKLLSGTRIYGNATIDTNVSIGGNATITNTALLGTGAWTPTGGAVTDAAIVMPFGQWSIYSNVSNGGLTYARSILAKDSSNNIVIGSTLGTGMFANTNIYTGVVAYTNLMGGATIPLLTAAVTANTITLPNTQNSTSTTSGALIVAGGVGIGGNLNVGGNASLGTGLANYVQVTGAATGNVTVIGTAGSDANVGLAIQPKGTGAIDLAAGSSGVNISNGGTVTAITRTAGGSGYTTAITATISAPTTAGGIQATANAYAGAITTVVTTGGTGYTLNDVITVVGGTGTQSQSYIVSGVSGGAITTLTVQNYGQYTALPTSPVSVTGGTGSSATLTLSNWSMTSIAVSNAGSGYVEQPTVSFSGGGGSGAAAYATVGSASIIKSIGASTNVVGNASFVFQTPNTNAPALIIRESAGADSFLTVNPAPSYVNVLALGNSGASLGLYANGGGTVALGTNGTFNTVQMRVSHTASAVNYLQVTGAATGGQPTISAQGSDGSLGLTYRTKGNFNHQFQNGSNQIGFEVSGSGTGANYLSVASAIAGASPAFSVKGSDTDINLTLTPKGTGNVTTTNPVVITNANVSTSTTTGALQVAGGVGIAGNLNVGGATTLGNGVNLYQTGGNAVSIVGNTFGDGGSSTGANALVYISQTNSWSGNQPWALYVTGYSYLNGLRINAGDSPRSLHKVTVGNLGFSTSDATSGITFGPQNGTTAFAVYPPASGNTVVNYLQVTGAAVNTSPTISALGTNANIDIVLQAKGTGNVTTANPVVITNANVATSTTTGALTVAGGVGIAGSLYTGNIVLATANSITFGDGTVQTTASGASTNLPLVLNDISNQFTGSKSVFTLFTDQTNITSSDVVDSRNMEVIVNGLRLAPYIKQNTYPWLTPYDSFIGFRVVSDANTANVIIYNSPAPTDQAILTIINKATNVQTRKYPYSATTIALGD